MLTRRTGSARSPSLLHTTSLARCTSARFGAAPLEALGTGGGMLTRSSALSAALLLSCTRVHSECNARCSTASSTPCTVARTCTSRASTAAASCSSSSRSGSSFRACCTSWRESEPPTSAKSSATTPAMSASTSCIAPPRPDARDAFSPRNGEKASGRSREAGAGFATTLTPGMYASCKAYVSQVVLHNHCESAPVSPKLLGLGFLDPLTVFFQPSPVSSAGHLPAIGSTGSAITRDRPSVGPD